MKKLKKLFSIPGLIILMIIAGAIAFAVLSGPTSEDIRHSDLIGYKFSPVFAESLDDLSDDIKEAGSVIIEIDSLRQDRVRCLMITSRNEEYLFSVDRKEGVNTFIVPTAMKNSAIFALNEWDDSLTEEQNMSLSRLSLELQAPVYGALRNGY